MLSPWPRSGTSGAPDSSSIRSEEETLDELFAFSWRRDDTVPSPLTRSGDRSSTQVTGPHFASAHCAAQYSLFPSAARDVKHLPRPSESGESAFLGSKSAPELLCEDLPSCHQALTRIASVAHSGHL